MYIRNFYCEDLTVKFGGRIFIFPKNTTTPVDESILPYSAIEVVYGRDKLVEVDLVEENTEIVKQCELVDGEEISLANGICLGGFVSVEGAVDLPAFKEEIKEINDGTEEETPKTTTTETSTSPKEPTKEKEEIKTPVVDKKQAKKEEKAAQAKEEARQFKNGRAVKPEKEKGKRNK